MRNQICLTIPALVLQEMVTMGDDDGHLKLHSPNRKTGREREKVRENSGFQVQSRRGHMSEIFLFFLFFWGPDVLCGENRAEKTVLLFLTKTI